MGPNRIICFADFAKEWALVAKAVESKTRFSDSDEGGEFTPAKFARAPDEIQHARPFDRAVSGRERPSHVGHSDSTKQEILKLLDWCVPGAFPNCLLPIAGDNSAMSSRETVIDLVTRLPEDMPLAEIAREIELLAGIKTARAQARRREGIPAEDARKLVDSWTAK